MVVENLSATRRDFDDYVAMASRCMELSSSLPRGSPRQIEAERDAQQFVTSLSEMNARYGFITGDVIPLIVQSMLAKDEKGNVLKTADNILRIMRTDPKYRWIRYNLITDNAEKQTEGQNAETAVKPWTDADEAESRTYIEREYHIAQKDKHGDALRLLFREREYNPIIDLIEPVRWDGIGRCEQFLSRWTMAEDTPYVREVSRLIFAGGIWRLYQPGCKFDDVPILIGTKQGEGKSSLIRFLAINDKYYGECNLFDGKEAIEQLSGKWIVEIGELLALTRKKEVEASKAYITRTFDHYRKPFDRNTVDLPRRCIFLGTSNNPQPLVDVQNRRWYPIYMQTQGYDLFNHEAECREYIMQCWAEMRDKYKAHDKSAQNFAKRELLDVYRAQQDAARQDDWREGAIEAYLESKRPGEFVCVRELTNKALANGGIGHDPSMVESKDIGMIMSRFDGWKKTERHYFPEYGQQRAWVKVTESAFTEIAESEQLPF